MATAAKHNKKDNKNKDKSKKPKVDQEKVSAGLSKFSDVCGRANDVMDLINQIAEIAGIPGLPLDSIPVDLIPTNVPDREHLINPKAILLLSRLQSTYNPTKGKYPKNGEVKINDGDEHPHEVALPPPMWSFLYQSFYTEEVSYKHIHTKYSMNAEICGIAFFAEEDFIYNADLGGIEFASGYENKRTDQAIGAAIGAALGAPEDEEEPEHDRKYILLVNSKKPYNPKIGIAPIVEGEPEKLLSQMSLVKFLSTLLVEEEEEEEDEEEEEEEDDEEEEEEADDEGEGEEAADDGGDTGDAGDGGDAGGDAGDAGDAGGDDGGDCECDCEETFADCDFESIFSCITDNL